MPHNKDKRVLWLLNHTTLREFEVPLMRELGLEVFTPKVLPGWKEFRSGNVTYEYDASITIPPEELAILNEHNFYQGEIPVHVRRVMNLYFGTIMAAAFVEMAANAVRAFKGRVMLRAFGLDGKNSYHDIYLAHAGPQLLRAMYNIAERFWLACCYDNIPDNEPSFFQRRSLFLPLGLPAKFYALGDSWEGEDAQILFVCPSIKAAPTYYGKIYEAFKKDFGGLPHVIAGEQSIAVDDPHVLGKLPRDAYDRMMQQSRVMFYHSREQRHLHYHPLEAIIVGMPLVYMSGGLLDHMSGAHPQPGKCETTREARKKIKRILKGDTALIAEMRQAQRQLLEPFSHAFNKETWQRNFVEGVLSQPIAASAPVRKIAVMLPAAYHGGSLRGAKNLARMIHLGSRAAGEPVEVVFSCVKDGYLMDEAFNDLKEFGIQVRETRWEHVNAETYDTIFKLSRKAATPPHNREVYMLPRDGISDFADCDHWLLVSDRTDMPIAPVKPYSILIYDYLQRYVPEIFGPHFGSVYEHAQIENARNADAVFVTTPQTRQDAIQYLGISTHKISMLPMEFDPIEKTAMQRRRKKDYFLWTTNTAPHKNHLAAIEALTIYYQELDGSLRCVISGVNTEKLLEETHSSWDGEYLPRLAARLRDSGLLETEERAEATKETDAPADGASQGRIAVAGHLSDQAYTTILAHAAFLWHPASADNGTFSVVEAAWRGVPALSADYPQMRFMDARFGLNLAWMQASSPRAMAEALKAMERNAAHARETLPTRETLEQFGYARLAPEFWSIFREAL